MSRTYRRPNVGYCRSLRHYHHTIRDEERRRRTFPNPMTDDIPYSRECGIAAKVVFGLHKKGWSYDDIAKYIKHKWKLNHYELNWLIDRHWRRSFWWWGCRCQSCIEIEREQCPALIEAWENPSDKWWPF